MTNLGENMWLKDVIIDIFFEDLFTLKDYLSEWILQIFFHKSIYHLVCYKFTVLKEKLKVYLPHGLSTKANI